MLFLASIPECHPPTQGETLVEIVIIVWIFCTLTYMIVSRNSD